MRPFTLGAVKSQRLSRDLTATHLSLQDALPKEIVKKKGPFLIPIADPLADEKMTKKVLKLAKKASKRKQTKRGTKEVVKSIRKGLKGCVILHASLRSQHSGMIVRPEGKQVKGQMICCTKISRASTSRPREMHLASVWRTNK